MREGDDLTATRHLRLADIALAFAAGTLMLMITATTANAAPPANDDFANPEVLSGTLDSSSGSTLEATAEPGEPDHAGLSGPAHSVWFSWQAPSNGDVTIDTCQSDYDPTLAAYTGATLDTLTEVASDDDSGGSFCPSGNPFDAQISFFAQAGTTYRIAVDGYFGDSGNYCINLGTPPPHNCVAGAPAEPPPLAPAPTTLPPPIPGETANVGVLEGVVLVKRPGEAGFTELDGSAQIPLGSQLDTTNGRVEIESASDFSGGTRTGQFYDGVFEIQQQGGAKSVRGGSSLKTVLDLVPNVGCGKKATATTSGGGGNGLWGSEKGGGHTTKGKKGSGSTRGTIWFVGDTCNGKTVAKVKEGKIRFRDFVEKKTVTLKKGDRYVAG